MKEPEARKLVEMIVSICEKYKLWAIIEEERKPDLKMIRVKEISIKVEK